MNVKGGTRQEVQDQVDAGDAADVNGRPLSSTVIASISSNGGTTWIPVDENTGDTPFLTANRIQTTRTRWKQILISSS